MNPNPVLFLHGGPGMRVGPWDEELLSPLAAYGFRIFLFDQAGSGLSDFLPVRDYNLARAVADVEAIRQELGAEKLILIGQSWGSTLAANYMAKYPDHVAKAVLLSPGPIWNLSADLQSSDASRTDGGTPGFPPLRLAAAMILLGRNPDAAESLLPQLEAEGLLLPIIAPTLGTMVCKGDSDKLPSLMVNTALTLKLNPGFNPYVMQSLIFATDQPNGDPHAILRSNHTPVMVMYGECDYLPWNSKLDYEKTLPNARLYYVPKAGHFMQIAQPPLTRRMILAFLQDQPDVVAPYLSDADPRPVRP